MSKVVKANPAKPPTPREGGKSRLALAVLGVYWLGIFIASHIPKPYVPKGWTVSGAPIHLGAYFVLTLLIFINAGLLRRTYLCSPKTWLMVALVGCYAALDEVLQVFIEGRCGSPGDWVMDMSACLSCVGLLWLISSRDNRRA